MVGKGNFQEKMGAIGVVPFPCGKLLGFLWVPLRNVPRRLVWVIVALCLAFAAVTPPAAMAQGHMLYDGFSKDQYARLMMWSGFRTTIFTLVGVFALVVIRRPLMSTESRV